VSEQGEGRLSEKQRKYDIIIPVYKSICVAGGGEPLLNPYSANFINWCYELGIKKAFKIARKLKKFV
jgi:MoaA/NifB/PqqE/SkfB family radical SAM enzyme